MAPANEITAATVTSNPKPTKDEFEGSGSSIPSLPTPSPSATLSSSSGHFSSPGMVIVSRFVHPSSRLDVPFFWSNHRSSTLSSPMTVGSSKPVSHSSSAAANITQALSGYLRGKFAVASRFLHDSFSRLGRSHCVPILPCSVLRSSAAMTMRSLISAAANINQARIWCWPETFLSFLMRGYNVMKKRDSETDLASIHPMLWSIEHYEISKQMLVSIAIAMAAGLYFSNSPVIEKKGMVIVADTFPVTFVTLLIGLLLRKISVKYSFLFQLVGIGLGVFDFSATCFIFLSEVYYKWVPVVTGLLCLSLLVMPVPALISYDGTRSEDEKDVERGD